VPGQVSGDGHIAFATVQFDQVSSIISVSEVEALMNDARAASGNGVEFYLGGDLLRRLGRGYRHRLRAVHRHQVP
jgi:hypothetical protein